MRRLLATLLAAFTAVAASCTALGQNRTDLALRDYAGNWVGTLGGTDPGLPLVLHVDPDATVAITLDSPNQNAFGRQAKETGGQAVRNGALEVSWPEIGAGYSGQLSGDGEGIQGTFVQGGREFVLDLVRAAQADLAPPVRPQDPIRPLPYVEEAVRIEVPGTDVTLAGTLTLPEGDGPFPGVVLLSGSGAQDRNETVMMHRPFLVLSDRLTRAGIAVLRYDDRGTGESTGTFDGATSHDFAADATAALSHLKTRPEVGRIGFVGHSEGGLIAPLAIAGNDAGASFIVALAGPFAPMRDVIARQVDDRMRLAGVDEPVRLANMNLQDRILDAALVDGSKETVCKAIDRATEGLPDTVRQESRHFCGAWFQAIFRLDAPGLYRSAGVPALALFGELDTQVAAEPNAEIARRLPNVETIVFEGANHLFQSARTGAVSEYATIDETLREDVMAKVAAWILALE